MLSVFVSLIKHFHLVWCKLGDSSKQCCGAASTVSVPCHLDISVAHVFSVRVGVGTCTVGDIDIMAGTECWTIAVVVIYGMIQRFDVKLERFQAISVFEGEYETVC